MLIKLLGSAFLFIVLVISTEAQSLKGRVLDQSSSPIIGAYIIHNQSEHHAHTNELGYFVLAGVNLGDSLRVSHIGFETKTFIVDNLSKEVTFRLRESAINLGEFVFSQEVNPVSTLARIDLKTNPVNTSQDILRKVPGLFIAQHAGGGKAEQIFLRGFDIDHGTDINITVDGMPVNMVSHAHGQGYSDLHFLIPETVERIDFNKGPYNSDKGNFATAGYVNFQTRRGLEKSSVSVQRGSFNSTRTVGLFNLVNDSKSNGYIAAEYLSSDGPFETSQNFNRINLMGRYGITTNDGSDISLIASHFTSKWDASGQIPVRAVASGQISNFGALDDTEGGYTSRTNLALNHTKQINDRLFIKNNVYYTTYDFELFSNFTFFLEDSVNGDQIRQRENRVIFGTESQITYNGTLSGREYALQFGVGLRNDDIRDNELAGTKNRDSVRFVTQRGDITESNYYSYVNFDLYLKKLRINPALRFDYFNFLYQDHLTPAYDPNSLSAAVVSPKLNFIYTANENMQVFLKSGIGFHSNDTRLVLERPNNEFILPRAFGVDLGGNFKVLPRLLMNGALWYLRLEQEFIWVGDAGIVEAGGRTARGGLDYGLRWQANNWIYVDGDFTYSYARSIDEEDGNNFIPLAPRITTTGGLSFDKNGFSGALRARYLQDRPANEDNSVIAEGYTIIDLNGSYSFNAFTLGFFIQNLLNSDWKEAQFDTESRIRLANGSLESSPVSEIHFTPGTPFNFTGFIRFIF